MLVLFVLACAPASESPCPAYSGFTGEGRHWTWRRFADDASLTTTLTELGASAVTLLGDGWIEHDTCDADGLWAVGREATTDGVTERWEYDPPVLLLPATLAVGDAWTREFAWTHFDGAGGTDVASRSEQVTVADAGETSVRAGAFDTLELQVLDDEAVGHTEYRAEEVGLVLDDAAQLQAYTDG